jgi:SH3 domain-containing YSC84-like protein 1
MASRIALLSLVLLCTPPAAMGHPGLEQDRNASRAGSDTATRRQQAAFRHVSDAAAVASTMARDAGMKDLLARSLGVYIVPSYGRAALGIGGEGGSGVAIVRRADGSWGDPAFFNIGGISIGLQAGVEGGPLALLLMNPKAVNQFRKRNNFSLSADVGLTVVNYSHAAQGTGIGDVVVWSGNKGLFGNAVTVSIDDIRYNRDLTGAYYGRTITAPQAIDSTEAAPQADALRKALGQ